MNKSRVNLRSGHLRLVRRTGIFGAVGILFLGLGGLVYLLGILPAQKELDETTALGLRLQRLALEPVSRSASIEDSLNMLANNFADPTEGSSILASILATAKKGLISSETFQIRNDDTKSILVQRRVITLPVQGDYLAVREWLNLLLKKHPSLSLDDLDIRRAQVDSTLVQAKVVLSIWLKPGSSLVAIPVAKKSEIAGSEKKRLER